MEIKAAVCRAMHVPVGIESIDIDRPQSHEVLVRTVATGVCHSDLHVVDGDSRYPLGRGLVLGHEGAGIVEAVGDQVTTLRSGDHVVACLSGFCGSCAQCLSGHPNVCVGGAVARTESVPARLSKKGEGIPAFAGIGSYAERMLLHENSVVKIDDDLPLDRAALVGCGVLTGVGAALRSAGLEAGQTAAVFGCGGVGLSIVQGARIGGARTIIALDRFDASSRWPGALARPTSSTPRTTTPWRPCARSPAGPAWTTPSRPWATPLSCVRPSKAWPSAARPPSWASCRPTRRSSSRGWPSVPSVACRPHAWAATASASTFRAIWTSIARAASCSTRWSPVAAASTTSTKPSAR